MAKKKRRPPPRGPKHPPRRGLRPRPRSEAPLPEQLPDRRAMEGVMRDFLAELRGPTAETPLSKAQDIVYRAFEETDPGKRADLAKQALALCPDCADAYVLLAEQTRLRKEALDLYQQAVAAGERALGPDTFRNEVGHFWGLLETRPYMRARQGLSHTLWILGRREEAVEHLEEMLRLNPSDNQGNRYCLASWLLDMDRDEDLARLLDRYDEGFASWAYTRTLLAFRQRGDTPEARGRLKAARKANRHVPGYLLGEVPLPPKQPPYYSPGQENEAIIYATGALSAWRSTPGALTWLLEATRGKGTPQRKDEEPPATGPSALAKVRLRRLPQPFDIWQVDRRRLAGLVEHGGRLVQPWVTLVASCSSGLIMAQAIAVEPPSAARIWDVLADAMRRSTGDPPHRPTQVQVLPDPTWDQLRPHLEEIGVDCVEADELDLIDTILEDLAKHMTREEPPGLLDMPGMTPERVAGFYRAAAGFYRKAPWKSLGYEEAIRVECDRYESGPWYAVVMGQSGLTLGIALYEDLDLLRRLWAEDLSDEENARRTVSLTVTFDPERRTPMADLLAGREHGWEVAGPEAYPMVFRKEKGRSLRPPLAWELELLEGCLRAVPEFMAAHRPSDTTPQRMSVPVASGDLPLVLSWVDQV